MKNLGKFSNFFSLGKNNFFSLKKKLRFENEVCALCAVLSKSQHKKHSTAQEHSTAQKAQHKKHSTAQKHRPHTNLTYWRQLFGTADASWRTKWRTNTIFFHFPTGFVCTMGNFGAKSSNFVTYQSLDTGKCDVLMFFNWRQYVTSTAQRRKFFEKVPY